MRERGDFVIALVRATVYTIQVPERQRRMTP
jgi:hypothetical protein